MILLLIIHSSKGEELKEKFEDQQLPNIESCPAELNRYTTDRGINCCEGPIENGQCKGVPRCTLSNNVPGLIRCVEYISSENERYTKKYCPKGTRFFNRSIVKDVPVIGECTKSRLSADLTRLVAPIDPNPCIIYKDQTTNEKRINSCWVRKKMNTILKPTKDSKVHVDSVFNGALPVIFRVEYIDELQTKNCLDRENMESILDILYAPWRGNTSFRTNIYNKFQFCDTIKEKLDARARDPNYVNPVQKFAAQINMRA